METESNRTTNLINGIDLEPSPDERKESNPLGEITSDQESDHIAPSQESREAGAEISCPENAEEAILDEQQKIEAGAEISQPETSQGAISDEQQTEEVEASSKDLQTPDTGTVESADPALENAVEHTSDLDGPTEVVSNINKKASVPDGEAPKVTDEEESKNGSAKTTKKPENRLPTSSSAKATAPKICTVKMSNEEILKAKQRIKELASVPRKKNLKPYVTYGRHPRCQISQAEIGNLAKEVPPKVRADFKFLVWNCGVDPSEARKEFNGNNWVEKQRKIEEKTLLNEFKHIYPPHPRCKHSLTEIARLASKRVPYCLGLDSRRIFIYRCYVSGRPIDNENYQNYILRPSCMKEKYVSSTSTYSNEWFREFQFLRPNINCKYSFLEIKQMAEQIPEEFRKRFFSNCFISGKDPTAEDWTTYQLNPYYDIRRLTPHKNFKLKFRELRRLADDIPESFSVETRLHFFRRCYLEGKDPKTEDWKSYDIEKIKSAPEPDEPAGSLKEDPYAVFNIKFPHPDCKYTLKEIKKMAERIPESFGINIRKRYIHHCYVDGKDPAVEDWTQYTDDPYYEFNYVHPKKGYHHKYTLAEIKSMADKIPESFGIKVRLIFIRRCWKFGKDPHNEDWTTYKTGDNEAESGSPRKPDPVHSTVETKPKKAPNKKQPGPSKDVTSGGQSVEQLISMAEQIKSRINLITNMGSTSSGQSTEQLQLMAEQIESRIKLISNLGKFQQLTEELKNTNARDAEESRPRENLNRPSYRDEGRFSGNRPMPAESASRKRQLSERNTEHSTRSFSGGSPLDVQRVSGNRPMAAESAFRKRQESERNTEHFTRSFSGGSTSKADGQNPHLYGSKNPNHSSRVAYSPVSGGSWQDNNPIENQGAHNRTRRLRPNKKVRENGAWTSENSRDGYPKNPPNPSGAGQNFVMPPRNAGLINPPPHNAGGQQLHHRPPPGNLPKNPPPFTSGNPVHMPPPMNPPPGPSMPHMPGPTMGFPPSNMGFPCNASPSGIPFNIPPNPMAAPVGPSNVPLIHPSAVNNHPSWNPMSSPAEAPSTPFPGTFFQPQYSSPNFNNPIPVSGVSAYSDNTISSQITRPPWPEPPSSSSSLKRKTTFQDPIPTKRTATVEKIGNKSGDTPTPLYIVHSGHPHIRLSAEEMDTIENCILEAILEFDDGCMKPTFKESTRSNGQYGVMCNDEFTKNWLFKFLQTHQPWPNASLRIVSNEPANIRANAVLPLCRDNDEKILKFIGKQNTGLDTSKWEVIERWDSGESKTCLNLMVDEDSAKVLEKCRRVNFKLGCGEIVIATKGNVGESRNPLGQATGDGYSGQAAMRNQIASRSTYVGEQVRSRDGVQYGESRERSVGGSNQTGVIYDSAFRGSSSSKGRSSAPSPDWHANPGTNAPPWTHSSGSERAIHTEIPQSSSSRLSQIISDRSNFPYPSTSNEPVLPDCYGDQSLQEAATDRFRKLVAAGFSREKALVFTQAYVRRQLIAQPSSSAPSRSSNHDRHQSNAPNRYTEQQSVYGEDPTSEFHPREAREMLKWFHRK